MLRRVATTFVSLICLCNLAWCQVVDLGLRGWKTSIETPYRLDKKKDLAVSISAAALIGAGFYFKTLKTPLTDLEISNPDTSKIPKFDLSAIHQSNPNYQTVSDVLEYTAMALPFLTFVDRRVSGHAPQIIAMYFEALAIDFALYNMTTGIIDRRRPLTFNLDSSYNSTTGELEADVPLSAKQGATVKESFFSGHTCNAATATFFGAKVFTDLRPHSTLVPFVWIAAAGVPAFTAYSRYKAGKHFPSDVVMGYLVGASVGYFVPQLHKKNFSTNVSLSPYFNGKGLVMTYTF